ncbi:probable 2-oxoglutarate-dependent dioxygenase SLC1 [Andrographis paniculata]|uniref:probable 2-oxoglutarate-dependent dioxygenase SLC1 n=1 Tax=Andrographis paniculata TaxID=175694 RepID=UPI0021E852F2|nr:probable 2-oxoglutarate-dependent dioxygenase SLC1 [Andrographis paniculata]
MSPGMVIVGETSSTATVFFDNNNNNNESRLYEKGVKNMYENGIQRIPAKYVFPAEERPDMPAMTTGDEGNSKNININNPCPNVDDDDGLNQLDLPIIDFAQLRGPNRSDALKSLAHACETYGFFQLVNHGIGEEIVAEMVDVCKRFFEMPIAEREKYMSGDTSSPVRYGTSFNQTNDGIYCWRDFLKLVCTPLPDVLPHWPSSPLHLRQMALNYAKETKGLFLELVEAILESLGLTINDDEERMVMKDLADINGSHMMIVNCYPPCPQPDLTLGMPPHSDYGFLTLLLQDNVRGLQIQHRRKWATVNPIPGSFIVNVGDHLEIFSNGRYKSVLHRVIVNPTKYRLSVASLHSVAFSSTVRPAAALITDTNPRRYRDTDFATFLKYITSCDSKNKNFLQSRKLTS